MYMNYLSLSWSTSRGADTYGYNIARLDSRNTRARYRCMGGGYDMIGTVFGQYLMAEHGEALRALAIPENLEDCNYSVPGYKKHKTLYGLIFKPDGTPSLDGACGIESMLRIANAIGLETQWAGNRKGHTIGYFVSSKGE